VDDLIMERSRRRIGVPQRLLAPHVCQVHADSARHFAFGYGDDNPLYCDPEYAEKTRWNGVIAPPLFLYCVGENAVSEWTADQASTLKGDPFRGFSSYQSSAEFEFYRPLRAGDRCYILRAQVAVHDRSRECGRPAARVVTSSLFANGDGAIVAIHRVTWDYTQGKPGTADSGRPHPASTHYSGSELATIDAGYDTETRRGARPRHFEDVRVGDRIEPRVKGPLVLTDIVVWHLGWGMQFTPPGAFALSRRVRKKAPALFPRNARNIADTVQRLHWDTERAQEAGLATSHDYGAMRESWLSHALTDWAGDDGWLFKLTCEHQGTNYLGDASWVRGTVTGKAELDGRREVHLMLTCENQRGEVTTTGTAVVLLPSRHSLAELPLPSRTNLSELLELEVSRHVRG
jgi:acyl dehydratase